MGTWPVGKRFSYNRRDVGTQREDGREVVHVVGMLQGDLRAASPIDVIQERKAF